MKRCASGFTLVELVVTIAVSSLVCLAATVLLITGMKTNKILTDTAQKQLTVKMIDDALESISHMQGVTVENNTVILNGSEYMSAQSMTDDDEKAISDKFEIMLNGTVLLEDVTLFEVGLSDHILKYKIQVLQGNRTQSYRGSVYFSAYEAGEED